MLKRETPGALDLRIPPILRVQGNPHLPIQTPPPRKPQNERAPLGKTPVMSPSSPPSAGVPHPHFEHFQAALPCPVFPESQDNTAGGWPVTWNRLGFPLHPFATAAVFPCLQIGHNHCLTFSVLGRREMLRVVSLSKSRCVRHGSC